MPPPPPSTQKRLTRRQADDIVRVIASDPTCVKRISGSFWSYLPPGMQMAGTMRNISNLIATGELFRVGGGPDGGIDVAEAEIVCTGISDATVAAIKSAKISGVIGAKGCDRFLNNTAHSATQVNMTRFGDVVFDWHATLRVDNPIIYRTLGEWERDIGGEVYANFKGF